MTYRTLPAALCLSALPLAAATCESLAKLSLPDTVIRTAESVAARSFTPPVPNAKPLANVPAFCRVAGSIRPTPDSDIAFEVWMPASGWNGRFQGIGNGGFAGSISWGGLANAVQRGYATASTDTGHTGIGAGAGWALGHPEKSVDFGYRAIHETTVKAKAIVKAFYGDGPKRSYFDACSNGGRQALMEAQRYPEDYDGIVAGAPANYWTRLVASFARFGGVMLADPAAYIPASKLRAIEDAALAACDTLDGVKDGLIENPAVCKFDPGKLLCAGAETDQCLTAAQMKTLRQIYAGLRDAGGKQLFPGFPMGGEAENGGWAAWITGPAPGKSMHYAFATNFYGNMVYSDPTWDIRTFDAARDVPAAEKKMGAVLNAIDPDLKKFHDRGGKLILYHGWSDAAIPAPNTINYYRSVQQKMGASRTESFVRLYMVPGMQHCSGGPAPNFFGQGVITTFDAQHDINKAMERWVEEGVAPQSLIATQYKGSPGTEVVRTRPLCPYPQVAKWKGTGSTDDAANFRCVAQ